MAGCFKHAAANVAIEPRAEQELSKDAACSNRCKNREREKGPWAGELSAAGKANADAGREAIVAEEVDEDAEDKTGKEEVIMWSLP